MCRVMVEIEVSENVIIVKVNSVNRYGILLNVV